MEGAAMRIRFHNKKGTGKAEVTCYPIFDDLSGGPVCYYLRLALGKGRGGETEPVVMAEFSPEQLRDFAVDLLGMIAVEEARAAEL